MKTKYKIWMHIEEIIENEFGEDVEYKTMDDHVLPLTIGEVYDTIEQAEERMYRYSLFNS